MNKNKIISALLYTILLQFIAVTAIAENIKSFESIGIPPNENTSGLDANIYKNAKRSQLTKLIKNLNPSGWHALDRTIHDLLTIEANTSLIENDIQVAPNQNLMMLRINTLLQTGQYQTALLLYNKIDVELEHISPTLASLGILAMLFNQEKALACVEIKSFFQRFASISLWKELNAWCNLKLTDERKQQAIQTIAESQNTILQSMITSHDYTFEYEPSVFSTLSFMQRALLVSEDRIKLSLTEPAQYDIPQDHIAALHSQSQMHDRMKLFVHIKATEYQFISAASLKESYKNIFQKKYKTAPKSDLLKITALHQDLQGGLLKIRTSDNQKKINQAIHIAKSYGYAVLIPLIPALEKLTLGTELPLNAVEKILPLFLIEKRPIPTKWFKGLKRINEQEPENHLAQKLLLATQLINKSLGQEESAILDINTSKTSAKPNKSSIYAKNIIENIDKGRNNVKNLDYIYENGFDLSKNTGYKLPSYEVLIALNQSSKNQNISTTLLLASYVLEKERRKKIYWGTLSKSILALSSVGLKHLSYGILAQAILEE